MPAVAAASSLLADLIALPTVNPMGRPYSGLDPVERPVTQYLEKLFAPFGVMLQRQQCSPRHENLLVRVPGRDQGPATLFESHADTVPADDWPEAAFRPRIEEGRVFGRGACDDKGCLAAMALALVSLLEAGQIPPQEILFLSAGDEEFAQTGIKHFVRNCSTPIGRGVFGEPTELVPVVQHKATVRWDIAVRGRSAHTARRELGRNAILDMIQVIAALEKLEREFARRHANPLLSPPALTVTMIHGGRTRNAVPDECTIALDMRLLPGMDPAGTRAEVMAALATLELDISHADVQIMTPALATPPDHPFVTEVTAICGRQLGRDVQPVGAPYGTDAAWAGQGVAALVLGPGSIESAHAIDEHIKESELAAGVEIYRQIMLHDWS